MPPKKIVKQNRNTVCFRNGRVLRNHQLIEQELWISKGKVIQPRASADRIVDAKGWIIAPGLIDIQVNGVAGIDFNTSPHRLQEAARFLPSIGVTSFLPTVISSSPQHYRKVLPLLQPCKGGTHGAEILGIHLEGPFINAEKRGAHPIEHLISSTNSEKALNECYGSLEGVRLVTLAPELPGIETCIRFLKQKGILVAAGHSLATWDEMERGIQNGITMGTHLFNAMRPLSHREPGLVGKILTSSSLYFSIIADGIHLHPSIVKIAAQMNPQGLILISDAMAGLGAPMDEYSLGTIKVETFTGRAHVAGSDILAGTLLSLIQAVFNFKAMTNASLVEALEAASLTPARLLGIEGTKGTLEIGADADLILINEQCQLHSCYVNGELACCTPPQSQ